MKHFYLQASRIHSRLNVLSHSLVLVLVLVSNLFLVWKVVAALFCIASYFYAESVRSKNTRYVSMVFDKGVFLLVDRFSNEWHAQLEGSFLSSPWLIILNLLLQQEDEHASPRKLTLTLYRDAMNAEEWRQLRVILRTLPANSGKPAKANPGVQRQ